MSARKGCRVAWDIDRARQMWCAGERVRVIASELRTTESAINGARLRWNWPNREKPNAEKRLRGQVWKRCYNCLGRYLGKPEDMDGCGCNRIPQPLSGVAA